MGTPSENPNKSDIPPEQIEQANHTWKSFIRMTKWAVIVICAGVFLIGLMFADIF